MVRLEEERTVFRVLKCQLYGNRTMSRPIIAGSTVKGMLGIREHKEYGSQIGWNGEEWLTQL